MGYFIELLGIGIFIIGALIFGKRESAIRFRSIEGDAPGNLSTGERFMSGLVFFLVGAPLVLTAASTIWANNPYWFLEAIFGKLN